MQLLLNEWLWSVDCHSRRLQLGLSFSHYVRCINMSRLLIRGLHIFKTVHELISASLLLSFRSIYFSDISDLFSKRKSLVYWVSFIRIIRVTLRFFVLADVQTNLPHYVYLLLYAFSNSPADNRWQFFKRSCLQETKKIILTKCMI